MEDTSSYFNWILREFLIESQDDGKFYDATPYVSAVQYYEDLFSPSIFLTVLLVDTDGKLSSLIDGRTSGQNGLKGGERVRLIIDQTATGESISLKEDSNKTNYYIYKIYASTTEYTREAFIVELCPAEVFQNETSRVEKKYKGNIGNTVNQILKTVLGTNNYDASNIEKTSNEYVFYGNTKRPFTVITWLCPKSIPIKNKSSPTAGTAGFLFYQNKNGFNFKSLDSLISGWYPGTTNRKPYVTYRYNPVGNPASYDSNFLIQNTPTFEKNVNIMENLRIGMYSSTNYFFDVNDRTFYLHKYKLNDSYDLMEHTSGSNKKPQVPLGLDQNPSRLMVRILDNFNVDSGSKNVEDSTTAAINNSNDNTPLYQAASLARYNLAFSQKLNITVPLNLKLTVGDLIKLEFPEIKVGTDKNRDDNKSGFYLIKELSHVFAQNKGYTGLKLIRDSYGVKQNA